MSLLREFCFANNQYAFSERKMVTRAASASDADPKVRAKNVDR